MKFRVGKIEDLSELKELAVISWSQYKQVLEIEHWKRLEKTLTDDTTYLNLLKTSECIVCQNSKSKIIGMAFLVPKGNPTEIYKINWSYIRFVTVDPENEGKGIGRKLTEKCIELANKNKEAIVALHTSEIMPKARKLYENLGFKIHKEIAPRLGKRYWVYLLELNQIQKQKKS